MNKIYFISIIFLFFNFTIIPMHTIGHPGPSRYTKKYNFIEADKEVRDVVVQGILDFLIDKPVVAFKQAMSKKDEASVTEVNLLYHKPSATDVYIITYSPWKGSPLIVPSTIKSPLLLNQDLANPTENSEDSLIRREAKHPQNLKFEIYHELAHIKNGDLDENSPLNNRIKSAQTYQKAVGLLAGLASSLFIWKSGSTPKTKCMVVAGIAAVSLALVKNLYYNIMACKRFQESMADTLACKVLAYKKDLKPIVHAIIERSFDRDYKTWDGKTDNPTENIGSTHPTHLERIQLCFEELKNSGITWTHELYEEIKKEIEADEFSPQKLVYLNDIHQILLMLQNKNPFPLKWQKEKYKKHLLKGVLEGYVPGSEFARVVKWKRQ